MAAVVGNRRTYVDGTTEFKHSNTSDQLVNPLRRLNSHTGALLDTYNMTVDKPANTREGVVAQRRNGMNSITHTPSRTTRYVEHLLATAKKFIPHHQTASCGSNREAIDR